MWAGLFGPNVRPWARIEPHLPTTAASSGGHDHPSRAGCARGRHRAADLPDMSDVLRYQNTVMLLCMGLFSIFLVGCCWPGLAKQARQENTSRSLIVCGTVKSSSNHGFSPGARGGLKRCSFTPLV